MCAADILGLAMPCSASQDQQRLLNLLLREDAIPFVDLLLADGRLLVIRLTHPLSQLPPGDSHTQPLADSPNLFCHRGTGWLLRYQGVEFVLPSLLGLGYLHQLLKSANRPIPAPDLIRRSLEFVGLPDIDDDEARDEDVHQETDLGVMADAEAVRDARKRLRELGQQIAQAELVGKAGLANALRDEQAQLDKYLRRVLGLRGKPRRDGSKEERARQSCRSAIMTAFAAIERESTALAEHLHQSVFTGRSCRYSPQGPVTWQL
jgi:hypothetical protein